MVRDIDVTKLTDCNITMVTCFWEYRSCNMLPRCLVWFSMKNQIFVIFSQKNLIVEKISRDLILWEVKTVLWISKQSGKLTILGYCFQLTIVEEITFDLDLNNSWFGMRFQCGNRLGLWRNVQISTEIDVSSSVSVWTGWRTNQTVFW